jgi:acyl-CoA-dependent ceramide synthase
MQVMQCVWFWIICRVAWRVVSGKGAADARSDDEG